MEVCVIVVRMGGGVAEVGVVTSGFPLVDYSCLSRARLDIIESPGPRGEPLGCVAEEKQDAAVNSCSAKAAACCHSETYLQSFL